MNDRSWTIWKKNRKKIFAWSEKNKHLIFLQKKLNILFFFKKKKLIRHLLIIKVWQIGMIKITAADNGI